MHLRDFDVQHRYGRVNGIRMHWAEKGDPKGPLVVLLHGFPELWWSWRRQIEPLAAAGYHVVAPDLRGYAETDKTGPYDLDTLALDVRALVEHVGARRAAIVGHDWGGAVAFHLAARHPESCARLVVMNCPHPAIMARALVSRWGQIRRSWYMFYFQLPWLPERALTRDRAAAIPRIFRAAAVDPSRFDDEELEPYREAMLRPGAASATLGWYRTAIRRGLVSRRELERYPVIEAPTLLIWAMDDLALGYDELVPGTERFVRDLCVERVPRCGHFVQVEAPERVNPLLLRFLGASA